MRRPASQWCIALVCLVLGLALVTQLRTYQVVARAGLAPSDQAIVINSLVDANAALRREIDELEARLDALRRPEGGPNLALMERELANLKVATGAAPVQGAGVEVVVRAAVRAEELNDLLNELRNAGAEAVAVNGQRLGVRSVFVLGAAGYQVHGRQLTPPFRFAAVGNPATLESAITRKGGAVALLRAYYPGQSFDVVRRERLALPAM